MSIILQKKEVNTLLGDIIKHLQPDRAFENFYSQLQSIVSKILANITDFSVLFSMDKFLQFLDLFQKESIKVEVCKSVTNAFLRNNSDYNSISDIVIINSMMQICKSLHDYVKYGHIKMQQYDSIGLWINSFEVPWHLMTKNERFPTWYVRLSTELSSMIKRNSSKTWTFVRMQGPHSRTWTTSLRSWFE